jgi:alpha-tubulin suppressor-like RCC1 family protein
MERLGRGQQMQYDLTTLPQFDYTIVAVALGQDHTLAVTKAGEVLSWGLNRFAQLGYVVETTSGKFVDEPIQATPKKILNPLRKEVVIGVAACKTASACWTAEEVYTWGTNHGQLGYDKQAHPVQVPPRKVTKFSMPIVAMSLTVRPPFYLRFNFSSSRLSG